MKKVITLNKLNFKVLKGLSKVEPDKLHCIKGGGNEGGHNVGDLDTEEGGG